MSTVWGVYPSTMFVMGEMIVEITVMSGAVIMKRQISLNRLSVWALFVKAVNVLKSISDVIEDMTVSTNPTNLIAVNLSFRLKI